MRADQNERVSVAEIRGLAAQDVRGALREMEAVASGTRCTNYFYHANLNPALGETLTPQQWELAADMLERELGLTGQPRIVVEHEKDGRTHRHVVWSRIDADSMTAISDSLTYARHERAAREIEQAFGLEAVESVLVKDRGKERPERNPQDWESFRGQESKLDPKAIKAEVTALWHESDNGQAFAAALHEHGYILAKGDRRDFCIIDRAGDEHSLARRLAGIKAADLRARLVDIDRDQLPTVAAARAMARDAAGGGTPPAAGEPEPEPPAPPPPRAPEAVAVQPDNAPAPAPIAGDPPEWFAELREPPPLLGAREVEALMSEAALPYLAQIDRHGGLQDGEPDGQRWHERIAAGAAELLHEAVGWVRGKWQSMVANRRAVAEPSQGGPQWGR
jgi:hypothetical protein